MIGTQAERNLFGAVIFEYEAFHRISDTFRPSDFSDTRLEQLWIAMADRIVRGEIFDQIGMQNLIREKSIRIDEAFAYVVADASVYPFAITTYADAVRADAVKRATTHAVKLGDGWLKDGMNPSVVASKLEGILHEINDGGGSGLLRPRSLGEILGEEDSFDWVIEGLLERHDRLVVTAPEGGGKALALETPIATPTGWSTMGALQVGDYVLGADGKPTEVLAATDVMHDRPCYRMEFSDGTNIVTDGEHQWLTEDYRGRESANSRSKRPVQSHGSDQSHRWTHHEVRTTVEIMDTLRARGGHCLNHSISAAAPLELPGVALSIDPYVLGAWLGDGHSAGGRITIGDRDRDEMLAQFDAAGWPLNEQSGKYLYGVRGLKVKLRELGVLDNKHVPVEYLRGSFAQRLALLQGLMDTDGTVSNSGAGKGRGYGAAKCDFSVTSSQLAHDVHELVLSLGIIATFSESDAKLNGRVVGSRFRVRFQTDLPVFRLTRKLERIVPLRTRRSRHRFVTGVVPVESVPVRCIQVANEDQMYLAGRQMVPTHNSTLMRQLTVLPAAGIHPTRFSPMEPITALVIDAENTERQWRRATSWMAARAQLSGRDPSNHVHIVAGHRLDITSGPHLGEIHRLIDKYKPDIVYMGPLYKLVPKAINNDDDAAPLITALDSVRERDLALIMEAHAGHTQQSGGGRDLRPRGSSALLGWPEFGFGLRPVEDDPDLATVVRWRGDREAREWPSHFRRGTKWPWEPSLGGH